MDQQEPLDLRDVVAVDSDTAGSLYALVRLDQNNYHIAVIDGRQEVLEAQQRQGCIQGPVRLSGASATQIVYTQPDISFEVRGLQVTPSGRYLLLHGTSRQDPTVLELAMVDLHGGQPLLHGPPSARSPGRTPRHGAGAAGGSSAPAPGTRLKQCRLHDVDPSFFGSRPGLLLQQASWHAHSEEHLLVLTSDNRLRLYHVTHSLAVAEQTLHLVPQAGPAQQRYGLGASAAQPASPSLSPAGGGALTFGLGLGGGGGGGAGGAQAALSSDVVGFAFGPPVGWGLFSLLLLAADGHVYALGPVAPFGMRCSSVLLEQLSRDGPAAQAWLLAAFGSGAAQQPGAKARWPVLPHVLEGASPALLGPLNPRARGELPAIAARAAALSVSHCLVDTPRPGLSAPPSTPAHGTPSGGAAAGPGGGPHDAGVGTVSTAVVGFADGRLLAYAVAGPWAPAWCAVSAQYLPAAGGGAAARVSSVAQGGDGAGGGAVPAAVKYTCVLRHGGGGGEAAAGTPGGAAGGAGGSPTPAMVLLDTVELPAGPGGAGAGGGSSTPGAGGYTDDEEDEDDEYGAGYGGAGAAGSRRPPLLLYAQCGSAAGGGAAAGGVSFGGGVVTVWACVRSQGCWSVTLPWSAQLPRWLEGGSGSSRAEPLPAELPPPMVTCVHDAAATAGSSTAATPAAAATAAAGAAVVGTCLLANPLLGGGLLLLTAAGMLHYHQPAGAAALLEQQAAAPPAHAAGTRPPGTPSAGGAAPASTSGAPATRGGAAGGAGAPPASPSAEERVAQVEAHVKSRYAHLLAPLQDAKLPKPPPGAPSPLTAASPEGFRHLTECISTLRQQHIRFLHGAHLDLTHRADALRAEAVRHAAAAAELAGTAQGLEARQAALDARVGRLAALHSNMVERAGMLASLHWSLPRQLSRAERELHGELAALETRGSALQAQWRAMEARAHRLAAARRAAGAAGGAAAVRMASVPEAQLDKVHNAVVAQYRGIIAARAALAALEQHAAAARADQAAAELEKGLGLGGGAGAGDTATVA